MPAAYSAKKIYTGAAIIEDAAVFVENNIIIDIVHQSDLRSRVTVSNHAAILAPAFIDIQIYGAASRLFAVFPDTETLFAMEEHCRRGGTKYFLPTLATNPIEVFKKGIDALRDYWNKGGKSIPGLHIEGPWINKIKRGAHMESFIHSPSFEEVKDLLDYGKSAIKMITLAPEVCAEEIVDLIKSYGIIVSAGHSNATFQQAGKFFENIHAATHLFNAMSALHHREPGLPAAVMINNKVRSSIVADGHHVDFAVINLAKKVMKERLFLITDAVTETTTGPYQHHFVGDKYECNGVLSGSALTMAKAAKNCVEKCDIPLDEALRMASLYPAQVLGLDDITGKIEKGFRADLVLLNQDLDVIKCI
ncbi:MAG TPA: N-acetylglucosamine-6-phosphate deacetylase [Chitinophagaceae bacterium]|nr:N-acetylglucosamine-6-phosphate deacetylase [Chitinophagaceae bacterium]